jgi:predicted RND superfamily exporter protein
LTAFSVHQAATRLRVDTSVEAFLAGDSEAFRALDDLRDDFGRDEIFLVLVEGDVFTLPFLERLKKLHDEIAAIDMELESLGQRDVDRRRAARDP